MATRLRRPNADGNYTQWTPNSGTIHYNRVYEADPHDGDTTYVYYSTSESIRDSFKFPFVGEDAIPSGATDISVKVYLVAKKVGLFSAKIKPFLRFSSTDNDGTEIIVSSTSYSEFSETITKPGGGPWTAAEINSANWEAGVLIYLNQAYVTQLWVEITYTTTNHPAPTGLECERVTEPTNTGDTPVFSAVFNANGGSGTADRAYIQVSEKDDFSTTVWDSGYLTITSVSHGNRCEEIEYNGSYLSSAPEDGVYYWRIKFKTDSSGVESLWSDDGAADPSELSGIDRDWHDADYPFRQKLTFDGEQPALGAGYLVSAKIKTGNRRIIASNGNFNESVQASGGFSIVRYGGKTHVVFLSKLDNANELGIWIVTINHITGEVGTPYKISGAGTSDDTHNFPVIDADNEGYLHVAYGCHGGAVRYRRSTVPNVSGSLAGDPGSGNWWSEVSGPGNSDSATYPIIITIPHTGRVYIFFRGWSEGGSYRWSFVYSDDNGETWSGAYIFIDDRWYVDENNKKHRVYCYGIRYDLKAQRLHYSWTLTQYVDGDSDVERGIWYSYSDYDETDGSSLDVGFNISRWADGTLSGRTSNGSDSRIPVAGGPASGTWSPINAITDSDSELSLVFTETLVLTKDGEPIVFWEQKFDQPGTLYAHQTNVMCAKWDSDFSVWVIITVSDQVNTKLRVRRSSLAGMADRDGIIRLYMPVLARTEHRFLATGDVDEVGTVSRASGSDNYAMISGGFSRISQGTWIKISGNGSKVSFDHSTADPTGVSKIFSLTIRAIAKVTGSDSTGTFYVSNGTSDDDSSSIDFTTTDIKEYTAEWATNPFTSSAWAVADLAALEFGLHCTSANEIQLFRVFMEVTLTRASDDEYFASEIHELISTDDGDTWTIREVSRNSSLGVPIMNHKHDLSGDLIEVIYCAGNDIFYLTDKPYGLMRPSGQDIRILYGTAEIDRVVADHFNLHESEIHFKLQEALGAGASASAKDYYIEFGNRNVSDQPKSDPDVVYVFFDSFEEWDDGDTITSWTVIAGTAVAYASPPQHAIKRYAGKVSMAATGTGEGFEAKKTIGSGLTNLYVEGSFWYEGTGGGKIYIGVRDSGGNEFRVGLNYSTIKATYYDGSWHDHATKITSGKNNIRFALLVNSNGCSAWADGVKICDDVTCLTSVDEIRLGAPGLTYFDFIKAWHSLAAHDTDTISSGFTDSGIVESALHSSLYQSAYDGRHDLPTSLPISKIAITLEALDIGSGGTPQPHWLDFWICTEAAYDPGTSDVNIERHVGGNDKTCIWAGDSAQQKTFVFDSSLHWFFGDDPHPEDNTTDEYAMNLDEYATEPTISCNKSIKIDCWSSGGVDPEITIKEIKVYYERRDLEVVVGDLEARGFYCDAALLGAGIFQFESDAKLEGAFIRSRSQLPVESLRSLAVKPGLPLSYGQGMTCRGTLQMEYGSYREVSVQCVLANLHGISQVDGAIVMQWDGSVKVANIVQVESISALKQPLSIPVEHLLRLEAEQGILVDWLGSPTISGRVILGFTGTLKAAGIVQIEQAVLLSARNIMSAEFGERRTTESSAWSEWGIEIPTGIIIPVAFLGRHVQTAKMPAEHDLAAKTENVVITEIGQIIKSDAALPVDNLASLEAASIVPLGWTGNIYVDAYGLLPLAWSGGLSCNSVVQTDHLQAAVLSPLQVPIEFGGSAAIQSGVAPDWLGSHEIIHQVCLEAQTIVESSLQALVEITEQKYAAGQLPINIRKGLAIIGQLTSEWAGSVLVDAQASFPIEWGIALHADGTVTIEHLRAATLGAILPMETGAGIGAAASLQLDNVTTLANLIQQITIESLVSLTAEHSLNLETGSIDRADIRVAIEHLIESTSRVQVPLEWTQFGAMKTTLSLPLSWQASLAAQAELPVEHQGSLEVVGGQLLIDWGSRAHTTHEVAVEYGVAITVAGQLITEWLSAIEAYGKLSVEHRGSLSSALRLDIEYGSSVVTTAAVPLTILRDLAVQHQLPMDWIGFLVTLLTVSNPQLKLPGALGACIALPNVKNHLLKLTEVTGAQLSTAGARDAALKLIDEINANLRGG